MADATKKYDFEEAAGFIMITAPAPELSNDQNHRNLAMGSRK